MTPDIITDKLNNMTQNITQAVNDLNDSLSWNNFYSNGILSNAFNPFVQLFGDWFFGLLIGCIGIAIFSWKKNIYGLIGYLILMMVLARVIVPPSFADFFCLILGLIVSWLVYEVLVRKKVVKERKA